MTLDAKAFFYPKLTGTHADSLAVAGLGYLLARLGGEREVLIEDQGPFWRLTTKSAVTSAHIEAWDGDPFYPYVRLKGDTSPPCPGEIDLQAEYARREEKKVADKAAKAARKAKGPKGRNGENGEPQTAGPRVELMDRETQAISDAALAPHRETNLLARFNQLRSGFKGDLELHRKLRSNPPRTELERQLGALTGLSPWRLPPEDGTFKVATSQWFFPVGGKGVSGAKPKGAGAGALPKHFANGFDTWLRCIGMYRALTVHHLGDDVRLATLSPGSIDAELLAVVRNGLRDSPPLWGRLSDVRAPLALARALVENSEEYLGAPGLRLKFARRRPRDVIRGFDVSLYKKMGTASALMSVAFLGIPNWASIANREDADAFLETLSDLEKVADALDDEKDVALLQDLARLVSVGSLATVLDYFALDAATWTSRHKDERRPRRPWRVDETNLRRILMGTDDGSHGSLLATILDDPGFMKVANAVRAATVHAQLHEDSPLTPRYGLAQAWRQKAAFKDRFVQELASFVTSFNGEIARKREVRRPVLVAMVTDEDLASVVRLIEAPRSSSALVAHLLLAFGFAAVKKNTSTDPNGATGAPQENE